jgi:hypothetical protein
MFDTNPAIMPIRLDPGRMPVLLPWIVYRVHHERVDVGNLQIAFRQ